MGINVTPYYADVDKYIKLYVKDFDAINKTYYNWQEAYRIMQIIGFEYYKDLIYLLFDTSKSGFEGGFIAMPNIDDDGKLIENCMVLTNSKELCVIKKDTQLYNPNENKYIYMDNTQIGDTTFIARTVDRKEIKTEMPYVNEVVMSENVMVGDYTLLCDNNSVPQVMLHRLRIISGGVDYITLLNNAIDAAMQQNESLLNLINTFNHAHKNTNTGFSNGDFNNNDSVTVVNNSVTFNYNMYYTLLRNDQSYLVKIMNGTSISTSAQIAFNGDNLNYKVYAVDFYILPNNIEYGFNITNSNIASYIKIQELNNTYNKAPQNTINYNAIITNVVNRLGLIVYPNSEEPYFIPQFILPSEYRLTTIWAPPYSITRTSYVSPSKINYKYIEGSNWPIQNNPGYYTEIPGTEGQGSAWRPIKINIMALDNHTSGRPMLMGYGFPDASLNVMQAFGNNDDYDADDSLCAKTDEYTHYGLSELPGYATITNARYDSDNNGFNDSNSMYYSRNAHPVAIVKKVVNNQIKWYMDLSNIYTSIYSRAYNLSDDNPAQYPKVAKDYSFPIFVSIMWSKGGVNDFNL